MAANQVLENTLCSHRGGGMALTGDKNDSWQENSASRRPSIALSGALI
jgi:hypothetical protein